MAQLNRKAGTRFSTPSSYLRTMDRSDSSRRLFGQVFQGTSSSLPDSPTRQSSRSPAQPPPDEPPIDLAEKDRCERDLKEFLRKAWHVVEPVTQLQWGYYLDAICEHLTAVTLGHIQNLVITIPPGCTKSITCGVMWPAWTWAKYPSTRFLCAANED